MISNRKLKGQQGSAAPSQTCRARWVFGILVIGLGFVAGYPALADFPNSPEADSVKIESSVCAECHEESGPKLKHSAHADAIDDLNGLSCSSCHIGAVEHVDDPSIENITNPFNLDAAKQTALCSNCHMPHTELDGRGFNAHVDGGLGCLDCHGVHDTPKNTSKLLIAPERELCLSCHSDVAVEFDRRSRHPVSEGNTLCLNCHDFTGKDIGGVSSGSGGMCGSCHEQHTGPFPYEHEATVSYTPESSGCLECHNPHGSEVNFLLKERSNDVCLQCHVEPPGHQTEHGGIAKNRTCVTCHSDTHGSFTDKHFLPANLQSVVGYFRDCFEASCHPLDEGGG
jgi:DmsE family decaheme c-type cytochrome